MKTKSIFLTVAMVMMTATTLMAQPNGGNCGTEGRGPQQGKQQMQGKGKGGQQQKARKLEVINIDEALAKMEFTDSKRESATKKIFTDYNNSVATFNTENAETLAKIETLRTEIKESDEKRELMNDMMELSKELRPDMMKINMAITKALKESVTVNEYERWTRYSKMQNKPEGGRPEGGKGKMGQQRGPQQRPNGEGGEGRPQRGPRPEQAPAQE